MASYYIGSSVSEKVSSSNVVLVIFNCINNKFEKYIIVILI